MKLKILITMLYVASLLTAYAYISDSKDQHIGKVALMGENPN